MPEFIFDPLVTDEDQLQEEAFAYIQTRWPDWTPEDGNLEAWLIAACARMVASARDVGSDVPTAIFRYYGQKVLNIPPIEATPSVVSSTWSFSSNLAGRTVAAGTEVSIDDADGNPLTFQVVYDVTVDAPGSFTPIGGVLLRSIDTGADTSGIGGNGSQAYTSESTSWVSTIVLTGVSAGGSDGESDDEYLDRLATRTSLLTPRPILAPDFELMAVDIAARNGVLIRALALDGFIPGTQNQIDKIDFTGSVTGGTYTITVDGQVTSAIPYNSSATNVRLALEALSNVSPGDVIVVGGPGPTDLTVEHTGLYRWTTRTFTIASSVTGGGTLVKTAVQAAITSQTNQERAVSVAVIERTTGADVDPVTKAAIQTELDSLREINFVVNVLDPNRNIVDVAFTGVKTSSANAATVEDNSETALKAFLSAIQWGQPNDTEAPTWLQRSTVYQQDLSTIINNIPGFDHWTTLNFAVNGGASNGSDKALIGYAPIAVYGTVSGTIT